MFYEALMFRPTTLACLTLLLPLAALAGDSDDEVKKVAETYLNALSGAGDEGGKDLLLGGVLVMLIALKTTAVLQRRLPRPDLYPAADDTGKSAALGRRFVTAFGVVLVLAFMVIAGIYRNKLDASLISAAAPKAAITAPAPQVSADYPKKEEILKNWPSFRGPDGNGIAQATNIPAAWDGAGGKGVLWKKTVPLSGFSSPVVWGKRLFLSGADKNAREIYCFDTETGALLWQKAVKDIPGSPAQLPEVTEDTGYAAPTMTTDGRRVFAIFATGDVVCFDLEGNKIWGRNLGVPQNPFGHASSLVTLKGLLFVQYDHENGARLLALDCMTGKTRWEKARKVRISWASPVVAENAGRSVLVLSADPLVAGYDPETGNELWSLECMGGDVGPSPASANGIAFVANKSARLAAIDVVVGKIIWESEDDLPEVASPLATDKYVFLATSGGTVACLDAKTGKSLWKNDFDNGFYSSPTLAGDLVYLMDVAGVMRVFKADREYKPLAESRLGEPAVSCPAFLNGRIYIRGKKDLFCIGN